MPRFRLPAFVAAFGVLVLLSACGGMEQAAPGPIALKASLSGAQENPPVASAGTGTGTATYNPATKQLSWSLTWSNLSGPATMAHFHGPAAPGANAGVMVPIGAAGMTSPVSGQATLNDAQAADLLAGRWYMNIHSATAPGGEIRGQVTR